MKQEIDEKTNNKLTWIAAALSLMFPAVVSLLLTIIVAYLSPTKSVIVYINAFGEATFELILFSIITIISFISLTCFWVLLYRTWKR